MIKFITDFTIKLTFFLLLLFLTACNDSGGNRTSLLLPTDEAFSVRLALTPEERAQGVSGIQSDDFSEDEGMLFVFPEFTSHVFWMPDTYFDLDIFFLDETLQITAVERNMMAHPGLTEPPTIMKTKRHYARYVLEVKSGGRLSKKLKSGIILRWKDSPVLQQTK